ncbi:unnamed protein product [Linum tenue]|uniref:CASP-like protein n=1 Tax=Linum tenue TaxID=586396 RepID=A0AAV0S1D7_9ROSI|nr:unnamed protein product [Linum tenue]
MDNSSATGGKYSTQAMVDGVDRRTPSHDTIHQHKGLRTGELVLRAGALLLTLAAAIVLGINKQTKTVPVQIISTMPPVNVPVSAKWHYLSAFTFFVVCNAIACAYAFFSLLLALIGKKGAAAATVILDLLTVALLFAGNGAATAVGLIGYKGNSHVRWNKVCNVFDRFCHQVAAALGLSLVGSVLFVLLVLVAVVRLHRKY